MTVGELGNVIGGSTPSRAAARYWNGHIPWVTPGELTTLATTYLEDTREHITQAGLDSCGARILPEGTLLVTSRATIGSVALVRRPTATNQGFKSIVFTRGAEPSFYYHLFLRIVAELERRASGTTFLEISGREFSAVRLPVPPLAEQRCIARILDTLDEAICKTEQLIAKLKQVKQGLRHDLLTRGIDENGELRDPERHPEQFQMSLLGMTPSNWDIVPLGAMLNGIDAGDSPNCPDRPAVGDEWGVLKVSAVQPDGFRPRENKVFLSRRRVNPSHEVRDGDLLITRANTYQLVGRVCWVHNPPRRLLLCDKTLRLMVNARADAHYLFYALQMCFARRQIEAHATGSSGSMKNISQSAISTLSMPRPPKSEQEEMVNRLLAHDDRLEHEGDYSQKLRGLKQALMEDLLSGCVRASAGLAGISA